MDNLKIYNAVRQVPESAKRKITGGRLNGKTDINPMWRIKTLTEQFGICGVGWYYEVDKQWMESHGEEVAAFVSIRLYVRVDGEWSKPIVGIGGSMFVEVQKSGAHVSDECYKMATTDAISVACKQLGIGADVYWEKDSTKYSTPQDLANTPQKPSTPQGPIDAEKERLAAVEAELRRTRYSCAAVCKQYKLNSIYDMTDLQIKDFLQKIKSVPSREAG